MPRRILLVDDDIAEIAVVKRVLLRAGHHTTLATNSTDAVAAVEEAAPELVLLAPSCENGDGAALGRQLASRDALRSIPIVLLGAGEAGEVDGIVAEVVPRPIDPVALDVAVRAALLRPVAAPSAHSLASRAAAGCADIQVGSSTPDTPALTPTATAIGTATATAMATAAPQTPATPTSSQTSSSPPGREGAGPAGSLDDERGRHEAEVARLERAAAEQEAIWHLRRAGDGARLPRTGCPSERQGRSSSEEDEIEKAAAAEAARRRVLAIARERAASAVSRETPPDSPTEPAPELLEGSLAALSMPRLLALAVRGRATGRLDVVGDPARSLWLEGGRVVGADSSAPSERAEEIALRLGLITREQHRQIQPPTAGLASRRVGALLLERGFLKTTELALLARRRAEEIAFSLFTSDAQYRFHPGERVPGDERLALDRGTLALALEGVRRRWVSPQLESVLGGAATLLAPAAQPLPIAELALSPEERRVWELADGLRTIDEILSEAPLDGFSTRQALAGLVELNVLHVKIKGPPETSARPSPGSIDLLRIDEKLEQVRRADYFAILGLGRTCTPYEVREASERLLSELAVETFDASTPALADKLEEIRRVLEEARDVLSDDGLRAEYLASLEETLED